MSTKKYSPFYEGQPTTEQEKSRTNIPTMNTKNRSTIVYDPEFEEQMDLVRKIMKNRRNALRQLAH